MNIEYKEFKDNFMSHFNGYVPAYILVGKDDEDPSIIIASIDMIAPFRLSDGPSRFCRHYRIQVTKQEAHEIAVWAKQAGEWWKKEMDDRASEIIRNTDDCHETADTRN